MVILKSGNTKQTPNLELHLNEKTKVSWREILNLHSTRVVSTTAFRFLRHKWNKTAAIARLHRVMLCAQFVGKNCFRLDVFDGARSFHHFSKMWPFLNFGGKSKKRYFS